MKKIWKRLAVIGVGISLFASSTLSSSKVIAAPALSFLSKHSLLNKKISTLQNQLDQSKETAYSKDTFVVKYDPSFSVRNVKGNGKDFDVVQTVSRLQYIVVKVRNKANLQTVMTAFQKNNKVLSVNRSVMYKTFSTPGDPKEKEQYQLSLLKIAEAQKLAGTHKVKVAVIDTGVDKNHPELQGLISKSYNVLNPINQTKPDVHGTHVTGIIAAKKNNEIGGYGINPNVSIISVDVFERLGFFTTDYTIAQGILYAVEQGAKVINLSLGAPYPSPLMEEAVQTAIDKGVTVVAAAGNDGAEIANYPANYEGVISVGSVNKNMKLSSFSTFGPSLDIVAPGEDIYAPIYDLEKKSTFETLSGTSMASPMVAGTASLLLSKYPNLTPVQVEYILEHTATDLGSKGYDFKYGNGLVNPTAALKFDIKSLPNFVKDKWTKKEILQNAELLSGSNSFEKEGSISKPFEQKWVQFPVKKGQYIQTQVTSSPLYDLKAMIHFYSSTSSETIDVNDVGAGQTEGHLVKAPFDGTIAIGVADVNGNYDNSNEQKSKYKLTINRVTDEPVDESTVEKPIVVSDLPFTSKPLTLFGDQSDADFFTFKTPAEAQVVKLSINGIDGVNSSIQVYTKDSLGIGSTDGSVPTDMGNNGGAAPTSIQVETPTSSVIENASPIWQADMGGYGEGETLSFLADPETEYYVKVSNQPILFNNSLNSSNRFFGNATNQSTEPQSSILPYQLSIISKVLPPDEDSVNVMGDGKGADPSKDQTAYYQAILDGAIPYSIGQESLGYIQNPADEDWYKTSVDETGIYELNLPKPTTGRPFFDVWRIVNDTDEMGNPTMSAEYVGDNNPTDSNSTELADKVYFGLKKNETYLIHMKGNTFGDSSVSIDPYILGSKLVVPNPEDSNEDNGPSAEVKNLPASTVEGNFALPGDEDLFYLEGKQTQNYSLLFENGIPDSKLVQKYPNSFFSPIVGIPIIYEDVNKNHKLDDADKESSSIIGNGLLDTNPNENYGSFKVTKGKNYIIDLIGFVNGKLPFSLVPYKLTVAPAVTRDEDAGSVVKNNVPSKPLTLKKVNSKTWKATGQLNSGIPNGDSDWYVINVDKPIDGYISFDSGKEVDGVISLYRSRKRIAKANYYNSGQSEILHVNLGKGRYYVQVNDVFGNSTIKPYTLSLTKK